MKTGPKSKYNNAHIEKVIALVECGYTIEKACKLVKIERTRFYDLITDEQKLLLKAIAKRGRSVLPLNHEEIEEIIY